MKSLLAAAIAFCGSQAVAHANDLTYADVTGSWVFETGPYNSGTCQMNGRMRIEPAGEDGKRQCTFTTFETCPGLSAEVNQACVAREEGGQLAIVSRIVSIEDQQPMRYGYAPDDWLLTIHSGDEMTGTLESASRATVIFTRQDLPVS